MKLLSRSLLVLFVSASVLSTHVAAQKSAPSLRDAERALKSAFKTDELSKRQGAIQQVRATKDPKGIKALMVQLHKSRKAEAKLRKKLEPMQKKRQRYEAQEAERLERNLGKPKKMGDFGALFEKIRELSADMQPIERDLRLAVGSKRALFRGIGDLVTALDEAQRVEQTAAFLASYEKIKKTEDRVIYLDILGHVHNPQSVAALVGVASNDADPWMRARALDALANLGDSRGAKAAELGLKDDYWQVRVAAISSLNRFGSIDSIPLLIEQLGKENGRLKGDVISALQLLTGTTKHDNVEVWRKWWKDSEETLRDIMKRLEDEPTESEIDTAMELIESRGFLLGVRRVLDVRGLSENAVEIEEAGRALDPEDENAPTPGGEAAEGVSSRDEAETRVLAALGRTIAKLNKDIRGKLLEPLLLRPLRRSRDAAKRAALIELIGSVSLDNTDKLLASITKDSLKEPWRSRDRVAALRGLGHSGRRITEKEIEDGHFRTTEVYKSIFRDVRSKEDELLASVSALGEIAARKAPRALAKSALSTMLWCWDTALNTKYNDIDDNQGVTKTIQDELRRITQAEAVDGYDAWSEWWTANRGGWLKGDEEVAKAEAEANEGGTSFYGIKTYSKRVAFVLDVSGSMLEDAEGYDGQNLKQSKFAVAKDELSKAIAALPKDGYFNIIVYSTDFKLWKKELMPSNADGKRDAREWLSKVVADGNTNIYDPIIKAFQLAGRGTHDKAYKVELDTIFFLSDGQPNRGKVTDPRDILREVLELNSRKRVQIHTVGVGKGHNAGFMRALAEETGGTYISR